MINTIFRGPHAALLAVCVALGGCASGARTEAMIAPLDASYLTGERSPFRQAITVASVTGGSSTNPLWTSQVSNEDFKKALEQSLKLNTLLAEGEGKYRLTVSLISLKQPFVGLDMTVDATARYVVTPISGGAPAMDQTFNTPYKAAFGDALIGMERLRLANEGAIRTSIAAFVASLSKTRVNVSPTS